MRVSPSDISGEEARAFIDYRDEFKKDKRRHVWCGPAAADEKFLEYDGVSWLDMDPKPTGHEDEASFSAPELTHDDKGRSWLVYTEGPREKGHLRMTPLGIDLQPNGRTFAVTSGDIYASEARLIALSGGKLVIVYLRDKEGRTELVSEQLDCEVKK